MSSKIKGSVGCSLCGCTTDITDMQTGTLNKTLKERGWEEIRIGEQTAGYACKTCAIFFKGSNIVYKKKVGRQVQKKGVYKVGKIHVPRQHIGQDARILFESLFVEEETKKKPKNARAKK
jgi:hypothetical protein